MQEEEEKEQRRNLIIFMAVSLLIILVYPRFFRASNTVVTSQYSADVSGTADSLPEGVPATAAKIQTKPTNDEPIKTIIVDAPRISGKISTKGLKFNDITLRDYRTEYDSQDNVAVFGEQEYFAVSGWSSQESVSLPNEATCWKVSSTNLTPETPVVLTWDNGSGLLFTKEISVDENFVFTITDRVKNYGNQSVKLQSVTSIYRKLGEEKSESLGFYNGPLGYFDNGLKEVEYNDISKNKEIVYKSKGGWFGITDKYWLVSFIPEQNSLLSVSYKSVSDANAYIVEGRDAFSTVAPSAELSKTHSLFIGAKEIKTLDMYENKLKVPHFDLVIDFGYLYVLTKPLLYAMSYVKDLVGNMGLGILLITLLLKLILFPLASKSYRSMNKMKSIQPKVRSLQQKYANDQVRLGQAVSELYKKEKINPVGGCLPMFLQWPILFALYKVLYISIEMRQAPFIGWIHDLSVADPCTVLNLGGLIPVDLPGFLEVGVWPLLMGGTMWIQQKMGPTPADPTQGKMMLLMPILFTFMFAQLPSGLIIYWTFSNLFAIVQQYVIMKHDSSAYHEEKKKVSQN